MADTAHQSFRDLGPASSSQSNAMQGAQGYFLSQGLQYEGEYRAPSKDGPILESDNFRREAPGLRAKDGFTTCPVNYFSTCPEAGGVFAVDASGSHLDTDYTTGSVDYFPTYVEAGGVFTGEASGSHLDTECTTGSVNYFPTYVDAGGVFTSEAPGVAF